MYINCICGAIFTKIHHLSESVPNTMELNRCVYTVHGYGLYNFAPPLYEKKSLRCLARMVAVTAIKWALQLRLYGEGLNDTSLFQPVPCEISLENNSHQHLSLQFIQQNKYRSQGCRCKNDSTLVLRAEGHNGGLLVHIKACHYDSYG